MNQYKPDKLKLKIRRESTAEGAIDFCAKNRPDLIFMDIKLPGINGNEAAKEIKKLYSDINIIAQSAYAIQGDDKIALEAGCIEYITKPIDDVEFYKLLDKYL